MSWESLGSVSTGELPGDGDWIGFALDLARQYILFVCGDPPDGCQLEVRWNDHGCGSYPTLGVSSEWGDSGNYFAKAEAALICFDEAVQWSSIRNHFYQSCGDEDGDDDEEE